MKFLASAVPSLLPGLFFYPRKAIKMITKDEYYAGRYETYKDDLTEQIDDNVDDLLARVNQVRTAYGKPMTVSSGWRPATINSMVKGAAPKSNHIIGCAIDIADYDGKLWAWCMDNLALITKAGLYLEDKRWTKTWVHFQSVQPASGKRIFAPNSSLPPNPTIWDAKYDSKYDSKPKKA